LAFVLVASAAGCARKPSTHVITIQNFKFVPAKLAVFSGDTIVFRNLDVVPHSAVDDAGHFDSHAIDNSKTWTYRVPRPGTLTYHCAQHPVMKGELDVQ